MNWVLDLDGVIWLVDQPIPGAAEAVGRLRGAGVALAFVTNNSYARRRDVEAKLRAHGIDPGDDVVTSAMAAATLIEPGERVLVCGGPGAAEEVERRGAEIVTMASAGGGHVDVVVVGYDPTFDYPRLAAAAMAVRSGARLLATNDDATYPTPLGPIPGAGAILASIVTATATTPQIAGKPHEPVAALVRDRLGRDGIVAGDRPDTDGRFAQTLGYRFGLVLTGVTPPGELGVDPTPDEVAEDLASLVDRFL